jgi:hypothetical protein
MKKVDERLVKVSMSPVETDKTYELGDEVELHVRGDVVKIEFKDNQDGTYNEVYIVKAIEVSD